MFKNGGDETITVHIQFVIKKVSLQKNTLLSYES